MLLSTKGRYGLRAVMDISLNYQGDPISINEISGRTGISLLYLEQIFAVLKKEGIISSVRGAHGGYLLSKPTDQITAGEILRVLEGEMVPSPCLDDKKCAIENYCPTYSLYEKIKISIDDVIDNTTIKDMVDDYSNHLKSLNR